MADKTIDDLTAQANPTSSDTLVETFHPTRGSEKVSLENLIDSASLSNTYGYIYSTGPETLNVGVSTYDSPSVNLVLDLANNIEYTGGQLQYTGTPNIWVQVTAYLSMVAPSSLRTYNLYWVKNWIGGAPTGRDLNSKKTVKPLSGDAASVTMTWWLPVSTGDYIDLVVSADGTTTIDMEVSMYSVIPISLQ